jgi:hypothetical protein
MNRRQYYAITHPLDEHTMRQRIPHCTRRATLPNGVILTTVLAVDR